MSATGRTHAVIVAMGGGGFLMEPENPLLDDYVLDLAGETRPRICFVPTASGESDGFIERFLSAFRGERAHASVLRLFNRGREAPDVRSMLLAQDVIYVGGGNTANMLAVWRVHGVDRALREAWKRGVVLAGVSAGMICWFECSVTDSFGPLAALRDGLGFLPGSACPHYDGEPDRRPVYHGLIERGLPAGIAADDGAAVVFDGAEIREAVSSRPDARAYRVGLENGVVVETPMATRFLGA